MQARPDVLIVGAGPTGLVLALWLSHLGVPVRIIDKTAQPGTTSRALVVQARILEFYQQIDLAREVVDRGLNLEAVNLWAGGQQKARAVFGAMGRGISPFPYAVIYPQDEHENLLIDGLRRLGVEVERSCELLGLQEQDDRVQARVRAADGSQEVIDATYVAGCDGAHSTVRHAIGADFPGGTYSHMFYVADLQASGRAMNRELNVALDDSGFLVIFPLKAQGHARFIGTVKQEAEQRRSLTFDDVSPGLISRLALTVEQVHWFSTYHVHHRVASRFHRGRMFLLGDAAHIHSPVGGQGMNTGIADAINLAWKLAAVLRQRAAPALLDSYEPERIAFARRLVATTDRAFQFINNDGALARVVRTRLIPLVLPLLFRLPAMRRLMFRTISQTNMNYRAGPMGARSGGKVRAGDRLPWTAGDGGADNFASLRSLDWQGHVYGEASAEVGQACTQTGLRLEVFAWTRAAAQAGLVRGALYLVRPDGYVALIATDNAQAALEAFRARFGLVWAAGRVQR